MDYKKALGRVNKACLQLSRIGDLEDDTAENAVIDAILVLQNAREALQKAINQEN